MRNMQPVPLLARTVSGSSAPIHVRGASLALIPRVTVVAGTTPSLTIAVHWSIDGVTFASAQPVDSFTAFTAAGAAAKAFAAKGSICRITWAIAGTAPSFTFSIDTCQY